MLFLAILNDVSSSGVVASAPIIDAPYPAAIPETVFIQAPPAPVLPELPTVFQRKIKKFQKNIFFSTAKNSNSIQDDRKHLSLVHEFY